MVYFMTFSTDNNMLIGDLVSDLIGDVGRKVGSIVGRKGYESPEQHLDVKVQEAG